MTMGGNAPQIQIVHVFLRYFKITNICLKSKMLILKQIVWETQKMALEF